MFAPAIAAVLACAAADTAAPTGRTDPPRDPAVRAAFVRAHPCPATERTSGACPGWVVDHRLPLCAGGADAPENLQWITAAQAREKDRRDQQHCAALRRFGQTAR